MAYRTWIKGVDVAFRNHEPSARFISQVMVPLALLLGSWDRWRVWEWFGVLSEQHYHGLIETEFGFYAWSSDRRELGV